MPEILAGRAIHVKLPELLSDHEGADEVLVTISLKLKEATAWADVGHEVAWKQFELEHQRSRLAPPLHSGSTQLLVQSSKLQYNISGNGFTLVFDRVRGNLVKWISNGQSLSNTDSISGGIVSPSFWRPPIDNDMSSQLEYWQRYGLDAMTSQLRSIEFSSPSIIPWSMGCCGRGGWS